MGQFIHIERLTSATVQATTSSRYGGSALQCTGTSFSVELLTHALQVDTGFLEAIVRGYKAGILTQSHYANLTQCETLEGMVVSICFLDFLDGASYQTLGLSCLLQTMAISSLMNPFQSQHRPSPTRRLRFSLTSSTTSEPMLLNR